MDIEYLKKVAQTGDVLCVHGHSVIQKGIEVATASPFCHVAMLVREPSGGLLVCEMEDPSFQSMTLADWLTTREGDKIFFGVAPDIVHQNGDRIKDSFLEYENKDRAEYGYGELLTVWLSQFTGADYPTPHDVCSLMVQHRWEIAGYPTPGCASPGDFLFFCESMSLIR